MRYKLIACKVLNREIGELASVCRQIIDITWLKQGLHNEPAVLRRTLQENIDRIDAGNDPGTFVGDSHGITSLGGEIDAILIGYGLCSNGVVGVSSRKYPIVIPRAHDCISLFLGDRNRYQKYFAEMSGKAHWYTPGWIENCNMPCEENRKRQLAAYTEKYGEDNAEYLMEMECDWRRDYAYAAYIRPENPNYPDYSAFTREAADYFGWQYREFSADNGLLRRLLEGDWDEESFLVVPPGKTIVPSFEDSIVRAGALSEADVG